MPNLARFMKRATVYNRHYASGNFTTPGTASLLTGTYPWTHRAFTTNGSVIPEYESRNLFKLFEQHYRVAYSHNPLVNTLLKQFAGEIEEFKHIQDLFMRNIWVSKIFKGDTDTATVSRVRIIDREDDGYGNSLFLSTLYSKLKPNLNGEYAREFPLGLPEIEGDNYFLLEDATNWMMAQIQQVPQPHLMYFHLLPPHAPYNTREEFGGRFLDDYEPLKKRFHHFSDGISHENLADLRRRYDEFILYVDAEIGRLLDFMETNRVFENSWVIFTSDHGELFERGYAGHGNALLFDPVIRVPLMISSPGQTSRVDVDDLTSCVDLIPTLLSVTGKKLPLWLEGETLPPFRNSPVDPNRRIFAMQAKRNDKYEPMERVSVSMIKRNQKLIRYAGYPTLPDHVPMYELFNLKKDPDELKNVYEKNLVIGEALRNELIAKIKEADKPYL